MGMACACGYRAGVIVPGVGYSRPGRAVGKTSRFWTLCMAGACLAPGTGRGHTGVLNAWLLALAENARITQFGAARIAGEAPGRRLFAARFAQNLSALPQAQSGRKTQCMELHIDCVSCKMHIPHYMGPLWLPRFPAVRSRGGGAGAYALWALAFLPCWLKAPAAGGPWPCRQPRRAVAWAGRAAQLWRSGADAGRFCAAGGTISGISQACAGRGSNIVERCAMPPWCGWRDDTTRPGRSDMQDKDAGRMTPGLGRDARRPEGRILAMDATPFSRRLPRTPR